MRNCGFVFDGTLSLPDSRFDTVHLTMRRLVHIEQFDGDDAALHRRDKSELAMITRFESPTRQISTDLPGAEIGVSANWLILTITEQAANIWVMDNVDQ